MTTTEDFLRRHFSRMGARLRFSPEAETGRHLRGIHQPVAKIRIDIGRDRSGEFFDIRCESGITPEVLDVQPRQRHMVLMVRDGADKNKFLLGRDEGHWFACAVPGSHVHDVRTASDSLRPVEVEGRPRVIRQGEWFFAPDRTIAEERSAVIHRNEPLSRGNGSKPHVCRQLMRSGGTRVMVCRKYPGGISPVRYERLIAADPSLRQEIWRAMTRDAAVYARGDVRHPDHKTVHLDCWHRVYLNREREAKHAPQIAFLD